MEPNEISYQRLGEYYKEVLRRTKEYLELDGSLEKNLRSDLEVIKNASENIKNLIEEEYSHQKTDGGNK